ncbi:MAG: site-specific integrase, partial [Campylobacterota bacterium]|nr:site-specific integrase [Campylobacterota bacterium]
TFVKRTPIPKDKSKVLYTDTIDKELCLEVRATGTKTFYSRTKLNNKYSYYKLGTYPTINVQDSRELIQEQKQQTQSLISSSSLQHSNTSLHSNNTPSITLGEFYLNHYLPFIKTAKKSYRQDINYFKHHILPQWEDTPMNQITRQMITSKHISLVQDNKLTPNTANKLLAYLSTTYNTAIAWDTKGIETNPVKKIKKLSIAQQVERYLTKQEIKRVLKVLDTIQNPIIKPIIQFLLLTGARRSEVITAKWKYIDLVHKVWTIPITKNNKIRRIPITPQLEEIINQLPRYNEYLFPNGKEGKPIVNLYHHWKIIRQKALIQDVRVHDLRHTYASTLVNSGRSLYEVQKLLGHSDIKVTMRYAHLSKDSLYDAACSAGVMLG